MRVRDGSQVQSGVTVRAGRLPVAGFPEDGIVVRFVTSRFLDCVNFFVRHEQPRTVRLQVRPRGVGGSQQFLVGVAISDTLSRL